MGRRQTLSERLRDFSMLQESAVSPVYVPNGLQGATEFCGFPKNKPNRLRSREAILSRISHRDSISKSPKGSWFSAG